MALRKKRLGSNTVEDFGKEFGKSIGETVVKKGKEFIKGSSEIYGFLANIEHSFRTLRITLWFILIFSVINVALNFYLIFKLI